MSRQYLEQPFKRKIIHLYSYRSKKEKNFALIITHEADEALKYSSKKLV